MQARESMAIIKLQINIPELRSTLEQFTKNRVKALSLLSEEVSEAISSTFNQLLNAEIELFLGTPEQQENKRNGYHPTRNYTIKGLGSIRVNIPKDRLGSFKSNVIPPYEKCDPRLKADMAILHLAGLSTRTLAMISKRLLGMHVNKDSVTQSLNLIKEEAENWLTRPIQQDYWALYIDGTNFNIQRRGSTLKEPSLVVLGVDSSNIKSILSIEPGTRDNVDAWRSVIFELKKRGLNPNKVQIGIMDGLPGLEKLFREEFPNAVTARCWFHAMQNILNKVPKRLQAGFKAEVDKIMYACSEASAKQAFMALKQLMNKDAERAIKCLEKDLDALLVHYKFDKKFWSALRTTNSIERVNKELKRRYKSMGSIGESTLTSLLAFTALRLEMGWRFKPIDSTTSRNLSNIKSNTIEETVVELKLIQ